MIRTAHSEYAPADQAWSAYEVGGGEETIGRGPTPDAAIADLHELMEMPVMSPQSGTQGFRGFAAVGLVNPKTRENVGSVLRAAGCYDVSLVAISGMRPDHYMGRINTDTQKAYRHIPTLRVPDVFDAVPFDCIPVAVELLPQAKSLVNFVHPERAFYIFGPEDGTLGKQITDRCKWAVQVPTRFCMNLAATVNVVLYDRIAKQIREAA